MMSVLATEVRDSDMMNDVEAVAKHTPVSAIGQRLPGASGAAPRRPTPRRLPHARTSVRSQEHRPVQESGRVASPSQ